LSEWAVPRSYKEDIWGNQVSSVKEIVKERESWKRVGRESTLREDSSAEAEESPLLEAVDRERWVKAQQAGKDFACAVVICKVRRLAVAP
jgi:hypothetical protein